MSRSYHTIEFIERTEAAAFVAALSRFLNSPAGASFKRTDDPAQVWATGSGSCIQLFLSGPALEAANAVFAPLQAQSDAEGPLPAGSVLLIHSDTPALGVFRARLPHDEVISARCGASRF